MSFMKSMSQLAAGQPLTLEHRTTPDPGSGEVRLRVEACAVCRTDLHVVDGELPDLRYPVTPGHEVIGVIEQAGTGVDQGMVGMRVGAAWLGKACGHCSYCASGKENLCDFAEFTGYTRAGGFASHLIADARYLFPVPRERSSASMAPWMCAGLIGWRALRAAGSAQRLGVYGFGSAGRVVGKICAWQGRHVYAFTRAGDLPAQQQARAFGAVWAGDSLSVPPVQLDAAIIFAPEGDLVPVALKGVRKGGCVVCGGIHMSDIPSFPYRLLWGERQLVSVTNLTRADGREFLDIAVASDVQCDVRLYPLESANEALDDVRMGRIQATAVLIP